MANTESSLVTPEQAKEFQLTLLQKFVGLTLEESRTLVNTLTAPTPEEWIKTRPARGGKPVPYIPGAYFIQRLNDAFGFLWSMEFPQSFEKDGQIVSKGRLTVKFPGRTLTHKNPDGSEDAIRFDGFDIVKEHFGSGEIKKYASEEKDKRGNIKHKKGDVIDLGDDYKGSGTDAMKKCGTEWGMFLDIYGPRESEEEQASREQFEVLYMRGEQAGMDEDATTKWAEEQLGKSLKEAEPLEIMQLIPTLIDLAEEKKSS